MGMEDPMNVASAFHGNDPEDDDSTSQNRRSQHEPLAGLHEALQNTASRMMGQETDPVAEPHHDRRFKGEAWESEVFDYIKQSYLLTSNWMQSTVSEVEGLDDKTQKRWNSSPSNMWMHSRRPTS